MGGVDVVRLCRRVILFSSAVAFFILADGVGMLGMGPRGRHSPRGASNFPGHPDSTSMTVTERFATVLPVCAQQVWHDEGSAETDEETNGDVRESEDTGKGTGKQGKRKGVTGRTPGKTPGAAAKYKKAVAAAAAAVVAAIVLFFGYKAYTGTGDDAAAQGGQQQQQQQPPPPQPPQGKNK